jgi:hypothetical protein
LSEENGRITLEKAKENLEYAINLHNCIKTPLDEKIIAFAEQDKTAKAYRDLAIRAPKGEDVDGYLVTFLNSALDRLYHWSHWIQEYEKGFAEGRAERQTEESARNDNKNVPQRDEC